LFFLLGLLGVSGSIIGRFRKLNMLVILNDFVRITIKLLGIVKVELGQRWIPILPPLYKEFFSKSVGFLSQQIWVLDSEVVCVFL